MLKNRKLLVLFALVLIAGVVVGVVLSSLNVLRFTGEPEGSPVLFGLTGFLRDVNSKQPIANAWVRVAFFEKKPAGTINPAGQDTWSLAPTPPAEECPDNSNLFIWKKTFPRGK
mgnify:CR=1 FL=1